MQEVMSDPVTPDGRAREAQSKSEYRRLVACGVPTTLRDDLETPSQRAFRWLAEQRKSYSIADVPDIMAAYHAHCSAEDAADLQEARAALSEANAKVEQLVGDVHAVSQDYTNEHKECERLRGLLRRALAAMQDYCDEHDGHDPFGLACGNCDGAIPVPHSLGCEIRSALSTGDAKE